MRARYLLPLGLLILAAFALVPANAQEQPQQAALTDFGSKVMAAAIAFFGAAIGAGVAIGRAGAAAIAAAVERAEVRTFAIVIVAFAEAIAIYGIVIVFFILGAG
ncbi:MAG: ATPase [Aigarchaeota archaeon]|nr:ATPase [Candidatus Pelearchaeum maunauluense]